MARRFWIANILLLGAAAGLVWALVAALISSPAEIYARAVVALHEDDLPDVERELGRLLRWPDEVDRRRVLQGALALRRGNPELAAEHLLRVNPDGPLRRQVLPLTGQSLFELGRPAEAEAFLRPAAIESPDDAVVQRLLAVIYFDWGAMSQARQHLEQLARLAPADVRPWRLLAQIHLDFEQYEDADRCAAEAMSRRPAGPIHWELRRIQAQARLQMSQYTGVLDALQGRPDVPGLMLLEAEARWRLGETGASESLLGAVLTANPQLPEAQLLRARWYLEQRAPAAAIPCAEAALASNPHDPRARRLLGQALMQSGDQERGQAELARADADQQLLLKIAALNEQAIARPGDPDVRDALSQSCREAGRPELAVMWARAAADLRRRAGIPGAAEALGGAE